MNSMPDVSTPGVTVRPNHRGVYNIQDQVFVLTRRLLAVEESSDPKGVAKAAAAAKSDAEAAAKEAVAAGQGQCDRPRNEPRGGKQGSR